jgi:hypothetical protein
MDDSYIQEQHFRINNALGKFEAGSTSAMWAILQGLYLINGKTINTTHGIPDTQLRIQDIDNANECEFYIAFTQKSAAHINNKIMVKSQMFAQISYVKSELYKAYSKYISENYGSKGINFITTNTFLGGK